MSALGHKQTLKQASAMSALHAPGRPEMSAKCHKRTCTLGVIVELHSLPFSGSARAGHIGRNP